MKIKQLFAFIFLSVFTIFSICATEKQIILGGENEWQSSILVQEGLDFTDGNYGHEALKIALGRHEISENTDLYLSFENGAKDEIGNYSVLSDRTYLTENAAIGRKAAVSREKNTMLEILGGKESIFGTSGRKGSFSIEFYLRPSVCVSGEIVFFWRSSKNANQYSDYQTIECSFMSGKLRWKFMNVFCDVNSTPYDFYLTSHSNIMPEKWSHHYLCYDDEEGILEYYIDGRLEDLVYTTDSGNAYGQALIADLGSPARLEICKDFAGAIDEFVISHSVRHYLDTTSQFNSLPFFVSTPLKLEEQGCSVISVETESYIPQQTDIQFFVRASDNAFELNDAFSKEIPWVKIVDGVPESFVSGRYFQVAAYFYTDGSEKLSPILTQITINYTQPEIPIAPSSIFAYYDDGKIYVSWSNNNFDGKYGYLLYYGTESGEFIGTGLDLGSSPVDCKDKTQAVFSNCQPGKIYYFAVSSYLKDYPDIIGESSKEVFVRALD